jgi:hypothetical protein
LIYVKARFFAVYAIRPLYGMFQALQEKAGHRLDPSKNLNGRQHAPRELLAPKSQSLHGASASRSKLLFAPSAGNG